MADSLHQNLEQVLRDRQVSTLFQPIVASDSGVIMGYEALSRGPSDSPLHSAVTLFDTAVRNDRLADCERVCRESAVAAFARVNLPGKLFLNVSPYCLQRQQGGQNGQFLGYLERIGFSPDRIVIELTEQYPMEDYTVLKRATDYYRAMGFEIAIDDLGAGYSGLRTWSEIQPTYVKIDRHFIQNVHEDRVKQEFVRSINEIARGLSCRVIAEGVETAEEFRAIRNMGIQIQQGYYFARPSIVPPPALPTQLFDSEPRNSQCWPGEGMTVGDLLVHVPSLPADATMEQAAEVLREWSDRPLIPIVDNRRAVGILQRDRVGEVFFRRFGQELFGKKCVAEFMDPVPLILDINTSLNVASQQLTGGLSPHAAPEFLVSADGRFCGVGRVMDLLRKMTDLNLYYARHANPLTLLPGNRIVEDRIDQLIARREEFVVAWVDIDHFKPFNDKYGYERGDQVIRFLAERIQAELDGERDMVGHIGGDDFIVLMRSRDWRSRCERIMANFSHDITRFYDPEDARRGGIWADNRLDQGPVLTALSISTGVVAVAGSRYPSHREVAAAAAVVKKAAKGQRGNALRLLRDRRGSLTPPRLSAQVSA